MLLIIIATAFIIGIFFWAVIVKAIFIKDRVKGAMLYCVLL